MCSRNSALLHYALTQDFVLRVLALVRTRHRVEVMPPRCSLRRRPRSVALRFIYLQGICLVDIVLVGSSGLEPPTSRLSGVRSNRLSYEPPSGGDERARTADPLLAKQVLSQLSYTPISL